MERPVYQNFDLKEACMGEVDRDNPTPERREFVSISTTVFLLSWNWTDVESFSTWPVTNNLAREVNCFYTIWKE